MREPGAQPHQVDLSAAAAAADTHGKTVEQAGQLRYASLESLRALAVLGVIWAHIYVGTTHNVFGGVVERTLNALGFGGFFLFVLSGCLLYLPFAKRDFAGGRELALDRYALNRSLRILPLYYVSLVTVFIVLEGGGEPGQWWRFATFTQYYWQDTERIVNGPLWTVCVEVQFYLLLPLMAWGIARLARGSASKAAWVLIGVALISVFTRYQFVFLADDQSEIVRFSLISTFYMIAAGMLAALLQVRWHEHRPVWVRGLIARRDTWLLASIPFWFLMPVNYRFEPAIAIASFLILGACILPLEGPAFLTKRLDWRPLATLGVASGSLYVWHLPVIRLISDDQTNFLGDSLALELLIALPLTIGVALLSYRLIEAPALRLRKRWDGGRARTSAPPARGRPAEVKTE